MELLLEASNSRVTVTRWYRIPLLHFLVIGAALFTLSQGTAFDDWSLSSRETIQIQNANLQLLRDDWIQNTGRPPTPIQMEASLHQLVGDEVLMREALKLGLAESDPVVNQRLIRNLRFAFPGRQIDGAALLSEARSLGMVEQDLVIRRRLVQLMEKRMVSELRFSEAELQDYAARHPERYAQAARYSFSQVFVASGQKPADSIQRAQQLLEQLRSGVADPAQTGDSFPLGRERRFENREEIARILGPDFASAVTTASAGEWSGPVASIYGWHLIRVNRVEPPAPADFERIRQQATLALLAERRDEHVQAGRERLIARYNIELPSGFP